jgi:hypothetical protein
MMKTVMIALCATALAVGCNRSTPAPTSARTAAASNEPTPMVRPGDRPTDMRPTNSPMPPNTNENRTGQSRTN